MGVHGRVAGSDARMSVIGSARLSGIHQSPAVDVRPSPLVSQDADRVPVDAPVRSGQEEEEEASEPRFSSLLFCGMYHDGSPMFTLPFARQST